MLMKELLQINEGAMKRAIEDVIEYAVNHAPIGKCSYEAAITKMVEFAKKRDHNEVLAGSSNEEIADYIRSYYPQEEHDPVLEAAEEESEWPKTIAKADEFKVQIDEDEQVSLLDGEESVRVTMPLVIWKRLCRQ